MSLSYPIPRGTREVSLLSSPGQTVFGPIDLMLYDPRDVEVRVRAPGDTHAIVVDQLAYTVTPATPATAFPAKFIVTLAVARPSGSTIGIRGLRVPARSTDVTRAGVLQSTRIETELDKMTAVDQELRRDISRALVADPFSSEIDAHGLRLANVGDPELPQDVVTKEWAETAGGSFVAAAQAAAALAQEIADSVAPGSVLDDAVIDAKVAANAAINAAKLSYLPGGVGAIAQSVLQVIRDIPPSVTWYGAKGDGTASDNVAIQRAIDANRAVFVPPGVYMLDGPLLAQTGAVIQGLGFEKTRFSRRGVWAGDTLSIGVSGAGGSGQFKLKGILFEQLHPGFNQGTSSTMADRLTSGQRHLVINGGTLGVVRDCWFQGAQRGIDVLGSTNLKIHHNIFNGSFDQLNPNVSETVAYIRVRNTGTEGICTMPSIRDNYLGGGPLVNRSYTYGSATYSIQGNGGSLYGLEVEGAEGLQFSGGYAGGQNRATFYINPNGTCTNLNFYDLFVDGAELCSFLFDQQAAGQNSNIVNIHNMGFNGQFACENIVIANNPNAECTVFGLNFSNNVGQGHIKTPLLLNGAKAARILGNTIAAYNARGGYTAGTPDATAGAYVSGESRDVYFDNNTWGGGANGWGPTNNCAFGPYFTGAYGRVGPMERAILGLGGGGLVGGLTAGAASVYS